MGKSGPTLGYRYLMTLFMGLCRGPVDMIVRIEVGGKTLYPRAIVEEVPGSGVTWEIVDGVPVATHAEPTYLPAVEQPFIMESTTIDIEAPDLFGGEEQGGEGGMIGTLQVMMGESTQAVNPTLVSLFADELIGAFRGILTMVYDGVITAYNPYPKPWRYRVRRIFKGWDGAVFNPATALIDMDAGDGIMLHPNGHPSWEIQAMNPAHIIYECMTNRLWGRGLPREVINEDSFAQAANTLVEENFGLCLKWARQDTVEAFVQVVLDHIGAVLYTSRQTGEMTLRLIRDDYTVSALPVLSFETGLLAITEDEVPMPDALVNEIIVDYVDPRKGETKQTRVQNLSLINSVGSIVSKTISYPGIPTAALANRVAQRDLKVHSTPLRRLRVELSRAGWAAVPGDVFVLSDTTRGIESLVVRVLKTSDKQDSIIELTLVQDVFGLPASSYATQPPDGYNPPRFPVAARFTAVMESSYRELSLNLPSAEMAQIDETETFAIIVAARPTSVPTTGYTAMIGLTTGPLENVGGAPWAPAAEVAGAVTPGATTITITNSDLPTNISLPGLPAYLDDELIRIDAYNTITGVLTVVRGVGDTIPRAHAPGSFILLATNLFGVSSTAYTMTQQVRGRALTRSPGGTLHVSLAPEVGRTLVGRHPRPYNVALVLVEGIPFYDVSVLPPEIDFTWVYRNRITQADVLVPHTSGNITPEVGTTVTIRVVDLSDDSVLRTVTGLTGTSWTYSAADWATDGSPPHIQVEIFTVRDGWEAWQVYEIPIRVSAEGWGMDWGNNWGGS